VSEFRAFPDDAGLRVERAIEAVRQGGIVVLVDDEDRENEGDLVLAAERVTPEAINFMAVHGRGLICMSMVPAQIDRLGLPMMVRDNTSPYGTAFTVSIEARTGVTTGISAADRARTIQVAVDPATTASDLVSPGHVFPLRARAGGVLERAGQTEGSVDLARLAGCEPAGVLCEIMNEDGTMARLPQLLDFADQHELVVLTVADLIAYRLKSETLVHRVASAKLELDAMGTVTAHFFRNGVNDLQYLALVKGDIDPDEPTLVRVTSSNLWSDVLQAFRQDGGPLLNRSMELISDRGAGVVLYVVRPFDADEVLRQLGSVAAEVDGELPREKTQADPYPSAFRDYGLGAQVLRELGIQQIRLLTNSGRRLVGVEGYGIEVVERVPVSTEPRTCGDLAVLPGGKG